MILTVNIGNTHITIAGYEHDTLQFSGRLHSSPAATVDEYAMNLLNLLSLYKVAPERIEGGILGSVVPALTGRVLEALRMLCSARFLTVGPGLKSGIKLRLGRYRHLHHGSERKAGAGGRRDPARPAAFAGSAGAEHRPTAPDRSLGTGGFLYSGQKHLRLLTKRLCTGHRRAAGWFGCAFSVRAWPGHPLLRHRQPAPHHPGGLPHPHSVPRVSDHGWTVSHLAKESKMVTPK